MEKNKDSKLFQAPAQIQGISTLKDRTLKMTAYISKELPGEEMAKLFDLEQAEGWLLFSKNSIKIEDVPLEDATIDKDEKTVSQRLRNTQFVWYMQNHKDATGFKQWLDGTKEKLIQAYKDKLV